MAVLHHVTYNKVHKHYTLVLLFDFFSTMMLNWFDSWCMRVQLVWKLTILEDEKGKMLGFKFETL